jgi:transposase
MKFLQKEKSQKIKDYHNKGYTFVEISKILKCSLSTIQKVKGMIGEDERK